MTACYDPDNMQVTLPCLQDMVQRLTLCRRVWGICGKS